MTFKGKTLAVAVALICAHGHVVAQGVAQTRLQRIEEVVVTANRIPVPLRQVGTSVAVIDHAGIEARGNLSLIDVLRQLPAVATTSTGGMGQPTSLRIRGEEGFRTLTILDGMRLTDPSGTQMGPQIEHLLSSGVERVEVLRGPQGLGYGADAGGVLNILTRRANTALQGSIDAQQGSFDTRQFSGFASGGNDILDFFATATDVSTDGFNSRSSDTTVRDDDGYDNTTLHGRVGLTLNDEWRVEFAHRNVDSDAEFDGCFLPDFTEINDCLSTYELDASRAALSYEGSAFSHALSYASSDTERDSRTQGSSSFVFVGELERWEYLGSATALPGFDLVFGADSERASTDTGERDNVGYFAELLSDFSESWYFTAGARHDDNDDFGTNTSYRLSTAYLIELANDDVLKFKGSIGTGFRAPSPYEIAYNIGPWAYPPASLVSLQQERSKGYEFGIEYLANSGFTFDAVYFDQNVDNAIIFDLNGYSGYVQDFGRSTSRGVELATTLPLNAQWSLQANYTWNETERPDGTQRLRRPTYLANAGITWQPRQQLSLHAFARSSRDSVDQQGAKVVALEDFVVLDLSMSYDITTNVQLFGRIENALDEQYQEVAAYNTADSAVYVGFRLNLGSR